MNQFSFSILLSAPCILPRWRLLWQALSLPKTQAAALLARRNAVRVLEAQTIHLFPWYLAFLVLWYLTQLQQSACSVCYLFLSFGIHS